MLAVYWRLLSMQRDVPEFAARAGKLLSLISGNTEKYFPGRQLYTSDERRASRKLGCRMLLAAYSR